MYIAHLASGAYGTAVSHGLLNCGRGLVLCQKGELAVEDHYAPEFQADTIVRMVPLIASPIIVKWMLAGSGQRR